ncbi:MAG: HlyD family efflux transporter periplasmic adaptor subunit [Acidobacteria bacterium]|nr:HlyD family efflux transporter periplasmic adaptor subunit [Acidobacteriota bacterium]
MSTEGPASGSSLDTPSAMLPQDPPPAVVRAIGWLLVLLFATALAALIVVEVPETVRSPFVLAPTGGADPIRSPRLAVVAAVRVTEGQRVTAGAELFVLRSDEIRTWRTELMTAGADVSSRTASMAKTEAAYQERLAIERNEIDQAKRDVEFRQRTVATRRDLLARTRSLAAAELVPKTTLIAEQLEMEQAEKELTLAERRLEAAEMEIQRMEADQAAWRADAAAEVEKLRTRIAALETPLNDSTGDLLSIRAPYDGVVIALAHRSAGNSVEAGQELCQIAPAADVPRARIELGETGLPRLAVGQQVRLFFEAFPYQRYGTLTGRLDWISPAAVSDPAGATFVAFASTDQDHVMANGERRPLQVGMKGEARIVVGRRRLIEYAFEPLRQLRENMKR